MGFPFLILLFPLVASKLLMVIELNRHGARTPTNFNKGPLSKYFGPNMKLTPNGYRQHQILGQFVRDKYINKLHFLNENFNPNEFEIFSTQKQRTIFSAEGYLSGLYPGNIVSVKYENKDLDIISNDTIPFFKSAGFFSNPLSRGNKKEITLKVLDLKKDVMFHPSNCKLKGIKLKDKIKNANKNTYFDVTKEEIRESLEEIAKFLNVTLKDNSDYNEKEKITELQKMFFVYSYHYGRQWEQLSKKAKTLMRKLVLNKWYSTRTKETKYLKLGVSALFDQILKKFENSKKASTHLKKTTRKFVVYSCHDTNLINILSNLLSLDILNKLVKDALYDDKIFDFLIPPFASSIIFELHSEDDSKGYYVKIYYNGELIDKNFKNIKDEEVVHGKINYETFSRVLKNCIDYDYQKMDCSELKESKKDIDDSIFNIN